MKNLFLKNLIIAVNLFFFLGCITTRSQMKEEELKTKVTELQVTKAETNNRFQEYDDQFRSMNGRIEVLERSLQDQSLKSNSKEQTEKEDRQILDNKFKLIEEALLKLEKEILTLKENVEALKSSKSTEKSNSAEKKGNFTQAEIDFNNKAWKKAVVGYQSYRDANPTGQKYAEATYKIGVCFSELGMKAEAKSFYEEVIEKFPKTRLAEKAQYRLKNIK